MNASLILTGLLLTATPDAPTPTEAPAPIATEVAEPESIKSMLKRLVPDEPEAATGTVKKVITAEATQTNAMPAAVLKQAEPMTGTTALLVFGLICAFGVLTLVNKRKAVGSRPLKRLAAESIGSRQQIVLVEALGEYLLVATGGREPVLLAQLDTKQARARLDAMDKPDAPRASTQGFLSGVFGRLSKRPRFEAILDETTPHLAPAVPQPAVPTANPAEIAKAQAALRFFASQQNAPTAAAITPAAPTGNRAEEIRRRLAAL